MKTTSLILLLACASILTAQTTIYAINIEVTPIEFVTVDPDDGSATLIATLDEVDTYYTGYSTMNTDDSQFIFKGVDFEGVTRLYTLNANTGEILYAPQLIDTITSINWSCHQNKIFGVKYSTGQSAQLVTLDLLTGESTLIGTYPESSGFLSFTTTIDQVYDILFVQAFLFAGGFEFYLIDLGTGAIIITFPDNEELPTEFVYNCNDKKLYGIGYDGETLFCSVNPLTAEMTVINYLPDLYGYFLSTPVLLADENVFQMVTTTPGGDYFMDQIDLTTGEIISSFEYDQNLGMMFDVFQCCGDPVSIQSDLNQQNEIQLYPNPTFGVITMHSEFPLNKYSVIAVINTIGELVDINVTISGNEMIIDASGLIPGVYFIQVEEGNRVYTNSFVKD